MEKKIIANKQKFINTLEKDIYEVRYATIKYWKQEEAEKAIDKFNKKYPGYNDTITFALIQEHIYSFGKKQRILTQAMVDTIEDEIIGSAILKKLKKQIYAILRKISTAKREKIVFKYEKNDTSFINKLEKDIFWKEYNVNKYFKDKKGLKATRDFYKKYPGMEVTFTGSILGALIYPGVKKNIIKLTQNGIDIIEEELSSNTQLKKYRNRVYKILLKYAKLYKKEFVFKRKPKSV